jgi:sugar O-acyltransferase (sialic acid O-acetyltransferase NeuD family)
MKNIIIIGASGHAKVIIDMLKRQNNCTVVGIIDVKEKIGQQVMGYEILGTEEILPNLVREYKNLEGIIAIGDNSVRNAVLKKIHSIVPDFNFAAVVDSSAVIAENVLIGQGTAIMPGVVVNNAASIGNFCILNTKSSLDHDSIMEDFSSLAPGVTVGGNVKIGHHSAISLGANIIHGIEIGEHTVVGAGSTVVRSIPANVVAFGVPAKIVRNRIEGERYLS